MSSLTLTLFVPGIAAADHADDAMPLDDLAVRTTLAY
jgi:hypothetical protein